jgi:sensor histidine kinase regulating citrate/malate metabolism
MSLERRLSLAAAFVIAATLLVGSYIVFADGKSNLADSEKSQIDTTSLVFLTAVNQAESLSVSHADLLSRDPKLIELMKSGDRAALLATMKPTFERLKIEAGVDVMHFHTADMTSFLRVWSPDDFGQDLSRLRPMVLSANKSRQPQKGLEIGLNGLSLRAVAAMMDNDAVVGTVEVGVSLASLMELAKSTTGADFAIYLDPQFLPDGKGGLEPKGQSLQLNVSTDNRLFADVSARGLVKMTREPVSEVAGHSDRSLGLLTRPLLDYSGKTVGVLVVAKDFTTAESAFRASWITVAVVSICGFLVAYGLVMIILRSLVFRPLEKLVVDASADETPDTVASLKTYLKLREQVIAQKRLDRGARRVEDE